MPHCDAGSRLNGLIPCFLAFLQGRFHAVSDLLQGRHFVVQRENVADGLVVLHQLSEIRNARLKLLVFGCLWFINKVA